MLQTESNCQLNSIAFIHDGDVEYGPSTPQLNTTYNHVLVPRVGNHLSGRLNIKH
jgi:hypothetical protein